MEETPTSSTETGEAANTATAAQSLDPAVANAQATFTEILAGSSEPAKPPAELAEATPDTKPDYSKELETAVNKMRDLEAVIAGLQSNIESNKSQIEINKSAMRDSLLSGLNVLEKYRSYAPEVDPFTDEGKQALENWAKENPELLASRPQPVVNVDTSKFKEKMRSPHLVDFKKFSESLKGGRT